MNTGDLIRKERRRKELTQKELADLTGISRITINKYENSKNVPIHQLNIICEELKSSKLRLQLIGNVISAIYLNNVDLNPLAIQLKVIEEIKEVIESLEDFDLINKTKLKDLTKKEVNNLKNILIDIQDVNIAIHHFMSVIADDFDIDLKEIAEKSKKKMIEKGYLILDKEDNDAS